MSRIEQLISDIEAYITVSTSLFPIIRLLSTKIS